MSKVYSFRLSDDNPREIQARKVIEAWISKGYSVRYIIAKALLNISGDCESSKDMNILLKKLEILLDGVEEESISTRTLKVTDGSLPDGFIRSISKAAKPGVEISE